MEINNSKIGFIKKIKINNQKKQNELCLILKEYNVSHNEKHNFVKVLYGKEILTLLKSNVDF